MNITDVTIAAAYNEAYNSEIYVECGLCGRSLGTGSSGPTLTVLIAAAQHNCPKADRRPWTEQGLMASLMHEEARASVALDGETQCIEHPEERKDR